MNSPVDIQGIIGTTLALMIPLIAVLGFTLRFTFKGVIEAYARARAPMGEIPKLLARIELLEAQVASMQPRMQSIAPNSSLGQPIARIDGIERI